MGGVLAWVTCYCVWPGWRAYLDDVLTSVEWVACLPGWYVSMGGMGGVLAWVLC